MTDWGKARLSMVIRAQKGHYGQSTDPIKFVCCRDITAYKIWYTFVISRRCSHIENLSKSAWNYCFQKASTFDNKHSQDFKKEKTIQTETRSLLFLRKIIVSIGFEGAGWPGFGLRSCVREKSGWKWRWRSEQWQSIWRGTHCKTLTGVYKVSFLNYPAALYCSFVLDTAAVAIVVSVALPASCHS